MGLLRRRRRSVGTAALCCCLAASARAAGDSAGPLEPVEEVGPPLIREESAPANDREPRRGRKLGTEKREGRKHYVEKKKREEADQAAAADEHRAHTTAEVKDYFAHGALTIDLPELPASGDPPSDGSALVQQSSGGKSKRDWCDCGSGDWSTAGDWSNDYDWSYDDDFHYDDDDDDDNGWYELSWFADVAAGGQEEKAGNRELKHHKSSSKWKGGGRSKGRKRDDDDDDDDYDDDHYYDDDDDDKWSGSRSGKGGKSKGGKAKGVVSSEWKRSKNGKAGKSRAKGGKSAGSGSWDDDRKYDDDWKSGKCKCDYQCELIRILESKGVSTHLDDEQNKWSRRET